MHLEEHAGALSVWLGVPRHADPASLQALLSVLRTAGAGLFVARLTCNGHCVFATPDPLQEIP